MLNVPEAYEAVLASAHLAGSEKLDLQHAVGRVLREPVFADRDYPPINRATMDGIAIHRASWEKGVRAWNIETTIAAGAPGTPLKDAINGCVQIMTGADVPETCDGVIPFEEISESNDRATATDTASFTPGQNIHARSSDRKQGDLLLSEGTVLTPPRIAIMASVGHAKAYVSKPPRVAVVSTGNEIVPITAQSIMPTEVRASNLTGLAAALKRMGITDVTVEHIADDYDRTKDRIVDLIESHDVLILSGGVSKGKFDFVPAALEEAKVRKVFHRVSQRPGKPLWFGHSDTCTVFGLPGNPVSTLTVFRRYVVPFLQKTLGADPERPQKLRLEQSIPPHDKLTLLYPVRLCDDGTSITPVEYHGSGDFAALSESDGFAEIPAGASCDTAMFYAW